MILLGKYGKDIPKTWDQLIETAAYIRDQEREQGNTDFDPFLGIFSRMYYIIFNNNNNYNNNNNIKNCL